MFTGIIEHVGKVGSVRSRPGGMRISLDLGPLAEDAHLGDSVAVNGVCLTICQLSGTLAEFDLSEESIKRSTLGKINTGTPVNLERAMRADGRFGGHVVQGHIDGAGKITAIRPSADFSEFRIEAPISLLSQMVEKGSVAVDGISLTVARVDSTGFEIAVIPATLKQTTWQYSKISDSVNIETDIFIKTIQKQLAQLLDLSKGLTADKLKEFGY